MKSGGEMPLLVPRLSVLKDGGGSRLPYLHVCRILIKMADAFFSSSWRIREPFGCARLWLP
jgi:hypothetical protein